ncbi:FtsQ-type POTRA domain-containing protein [Arthrobacter sp. B10-11]|uniref:FtsQ-type POTRA domain-containing protein n=1 Tax=Arthrobacter sp. B10-11 TaxID=3081160 RepID=UPI0029537EC0|nr:FtsQ-type POTRA domain-containing protein [Arthrobacter sp. B10-11]MDV8148573.1 FtsQ-type POTRA domain-containing protein [Arthrobacter sp. B10-11]
MASTRRPTYKTGRSAPKGKAEPGNGHADVISASKDAPAADRAATPERPAANVLSFPEPKGKRVRRNLILAVSIIAALVAGLLAAAVYSPVFAVRTVSVDGTKMLTPEQVKAALEPLHGKPLPQVNDDEVKQLLQPLVQVKDVTTEARPPSVLVVHIHERTPVALVKQGDAFQLVDVDGVQLGTTQDPGSVQLPVIDGGAGVIGKDLFKAITAVLAALPADVLARLSDASAKSVDAVELKLVDGQTIVWGNAGEKELKARVLAALLKAPADPKNPVRVYDVSVPRHPVTR